MTSIREAAGLNIGWDTEYPDRRFVVSPNPSIQTRDSSTNETSMASLHALSSNNSRRTICDTNREVNNLASHINPCYVENWMK